MSNQSPRIVALTGAASGIGLLLASRYTERGDLVIGLDRDEAGLNRAAEHIGAGFHPVQVDLADPTDIRRAFSELPQELQAVDILINNAGIVSGKYLLEHTDEDIRRTFAVNVESHFHTTKAVLPGMLERGSGHIVTVASAGGFSAAARMSAYASSKFAAVGFDDALRVEAKRLDWPIDTTLVAPFYIDTGMFEGVHSRVSFLLPILDPNYVVTRMMRAIDRRKKRLIMPRFVYVGLMIRALPVRFYDALSGLFGISRTMDHFTGRTS